MEYFVKYIAQGQYNGDIVIPSGTEKQVTKEQYDYLNSTFGASGWFNFRTVGKEQTKKTIRRKSKGTKKVTEEATEKAKD